MGVHEIGPHSRPHMLLKLDGRTKEARLMAATRAELTAHVGGRPSAVQRTLIERVARLKLYIELMDAKAIDAGGLTERDSRQYLAWSNSLRLALRDLGLEGRNKPTRLADVLKGAE
jgi:hypothetical protein